MIEIKNLKGEVIHTLYADTLRRADLYGADLRRADLRRADLRRADLRGADLREADLREADLHRADLREADLRRADLYGADLRRADLCGVDLCRADLRGAYLYGKPLSKTPLQLYNLHWPICITEQHMQIGCKTYMHEEWSSFDDETIDEMERRALEFWREWKEPLLAMCAAHRGEKK